MAFGGIVIFLDAETIPENQRHQVNGANRFLVFGVLRDIRRPLRIPLTN
jgi:hypothetical protein